MGDVEEDQVVVVTEGTRMVSCRILLQAVSFNIPRRHIIELEIQ